MSKRSAYRAGPATRIRQLALAMMLGFGASSAVQSAVDVQVVYTDAEGIEKNLDVQYRWLIQEDATLQSLPGDVAQSGKHLALAFHNSHQPVVARGRSDDGSLAAALAALDPARRYFISVLPDDQYALGGAAILPQAGEFAAKWPGGVPSNVKVYVNKFPIPTAQISVFIFEDNATINNAPDLPAECGLGNFEIKLIEGGGTYGASGGQVTTDAFGNPLGTQYKSTDPALQFATEAANLLRDASGTPVVAALGSGRLLTPSFNTTDAQGNTVCDPRTGEMNVRWLAPGKYSIIAVPPSGSDWHQTSTIEGTPVVDAWVKANEPSFFQEFGPPGHHVFTGFVRTYNDPQGVVAGGTQKVSGRIVNSHMGRPPLYSFNPGEPVKNCWVGINQGTTGVFAKRCNADSTFEFTGLKPGTYQLVVWDEFLDRVFAFHTFVVGDAGDAVLGDVAIFNWFGRFKNTVFYDTNQNGFKDPGEIGRENVPVNLRFRDGSVYQSFTTDATGNATFEEVFPFFHWLVAEVDGARERPTGATFVVDAGGVVPPDAGWAMPSFNLLTPQRQLETGADGAAVPFAYAPNPNTGNEFSRTEQGPVLTQAMQLFLGQTNVAMWGKSLYDRPFDPKIVAPDGTVLNRWGQPFTSNGGISGMVRYQTTRAENDAQTAGAENWEPGIPRVQMNLYGVKAVGTDNYFADASGNQIMKDDGTGTLTPVKTTEFARMCAPDVDNYPLGWAEGGAKGAEDVDHACNNGAADPAAFAQGDALQVTWTDSFDDSTPTGCPLDETQEEFRDAAGNKVDCYDGIRGWNQLRPGVFDGGYAFGPLAGEAALKEGRYLVEVALPPGYEVQKIGDKNVDFGESYTAAANAQDPGDQGVPGDLGLGSGGNGLIAGCEGDIYEVPEYLNLFGPGKVAAGAENLVKNPVWMPGPNSEPMQARTCDRKIVNLGYQQNAATDFHLFTEVPLAGQMVGMILDDLSNEFDLASPNFGEKYAPPHVPVAIYDWQGHEIQRVYADQWGRFNAMVPSTFTMNMPMPSGVSPNMLTACMNSPGPISVPDGAGGVRQDIDPFFDRRYSQFCYTFQYMPGKTTYLDTPVVPVSAFAGPNQFPADCEYADEKPVIYSVQGTSGGLTKLIQPGPYIPELWTANNSLARTPSLKIISAGLMDVPNPAYNLDPNAGPVDDRKTIKRDLGFGDFRLNTSKATLSRMVRPDPNGPWVKEEYNLQVALWSNDIVTAHIRAVGVEGSPNVVPGPGAYQLTVYRARYLGTTPNGVEQWESVPSELAVTVTIGGPTPKVVDAAGQFPGSFRTIQQAVDAAAEGDLILVQPGRYLEMVVMHKPVKLQGWGALATAINPVKVPAENLNRWRDRMQTLVGNKPGIPAVVDLIPGQPNGAGLTFNEPLLFGAEEGAGITVVAKNGAWDPNESRIDGLTVTGADHAGGIFVNGYARHLEISNNKIAGNNGTYGGGIRLGHPTVVDPASNTLSDARNEFVRIHNNQVVQNGLETVDGAGGGIALYSGSHNYRISGNFVCGNFSMGHGGGIGHYGLSHDGEISDNTIVFNQSFAQGQTVSGGGLFVGGGNVLGAQLSEGAGNVLIDRNTIIGNNAGGGDGGGVMLDQVTGAAGGNGALARYTATVTNNIVANNVAGALGGGIVLHDAMDAVIAHNTVVYNDSTATAAKAFPPGFGAVAVGVADTLPQPAGIVSTQHSGALLAKLSVANGFSDPALVNNIVAFNRSFFWRVDRDGTAGQNFGLLARSAAAGAPSDYWDLAVHGTGVATDRLSPSSSLLTSLTDQGNPAISYGPVALTGNRQFIAGDPANPAEAVFARPRFNGPRNENSQTVRQAEQNAYATTAAAVDEGGNFITVAYGPLTLTELGACATGTCPRKVLDYHLGRNVVGNADSSQAINRGAPLLGLPATTLQDVDGQDRVSVPDIGADEYGRPYNLNLQ